MNADSSNNSSQEILEKNQRFSKSLLWKLQQEAYIQFGPEAWSKKGVPFYLTSNPLTAKQYASLVLGYLRDCLSTASINFSAPLYIFDLGAGSGMFCYLFLKQLQGLIKGLPFEKIKIVYVMTDIAEENISFWKQHPLLQPYIDADILDFAYYHSEMQQPIQLIRSGKVLAKEKGANPLIIIANYFFDTIPQDLFLFKDGKVQEGRVTLTAPKNSSSLIEELQHQYDYFSIENSETYYSNSKWNSFLHSYSKQVEGIPFLFPVGAFQTIDYFCSLSQENCLVLAGDQGFSTLNQVESWGEPKITRHATFSIPVSYYALSQYVKSLKGEGLLTSFPDPLFTVLAAVIGKSKLPETQLAFREGIDAFEPKDYWTVVGGLFKPEIELSLEEILGVIKFGNFDPVNFNIFFQRILALLPKASDATKEMLLQFIRRVYDHFYPVGTDSSDFVLNLGVLCFELQKYEEALFYFEESLKIGGEKKQTLINLNACHKALQK